MTSPISTPLSRLVFLLLVKPSAAFLTEFSSLLTSLCAMSPTVILIGDFNIHIDNPSSIFAKDFTSLLDCLGITQHVNLPIHNKGHILDLICCTDITPTNLNVTDFPISDHKAVLFDIHTQLHKAKEQRTVFFRNIKHIDTTDLSTLISSYPSPHPASSPADLVTHYNNCLSFSLTTLAPLKKRSVSFTHTAPWFTPELRQLKATGRRLERLYERTGLTVHSQMYSDHLHHYKDALTTAKSSYYSNLINTGTGNNRVLFSTVSRLLQPPKTLPPDISTDQCTAFLDFFNSKINTIHQQLASSCTSPKDPPWMITTGQPLISCLSDFTPASEHTISEYINKAKTTTCQLDPLPTSLVKACLPSISPMITNIINSSLTTGIVPPILKLAAITPILKKPGADPLTRTTFFHLRNISRLRPSLTQSSTEILVHSFVTSHIDYCNALLTGLPTKLINRLQIIQNSAARIITGTKSPDHITPVLIQLHWLPVQYRIHYKNLLLTYKALHNLAPTYLSDLLHQHTPSHTLRSTSAELLTIPTSRLKTMGDRAFGQTPSHHSNPNLKLTYSNWHSPYKLDSVHFCFMLSHVFMLLLLFFNALKF
ncbi:uncharacterized protein PAE49_001834 [Odontesthes bonariensis]|uniref:uncharacterized protein LOC142375450 n=1 Tax=Odontesthes bonariensis TaxID=219752 RepID=UPI003F58EF23